MNRKPLLLLGLCLLSLAAGEARATDMEYCAELTAMYRKYLGQVQGINLMLATQSKDFERHKNALYGILYSTKITH